MVKEVIRWIMGREEMKEALGIIDQQSAYKIARPLERFTKEAYKFIEFLETQRPLIEFINQKRPDN